MSEIDNFSEGAWLVEPAPATIGAQPATVVVVTSLAEMSRSVAVLEHLLRRSVSETFGLAHVRADRMKLKKLVKS